jgi:hypothetical protein
MSDHGITIAATCGQVQDRVDHARKHLDEVERQLDVIENGSGIDVRWRAIGAALEHLSVAESDMRAAKIPLST